MVDCGDLPISPFDNGLAFAQMEDWYKRILYREVKSGENGIMSAKVGAVLPELLNASTKIYLDGPSAPTDHCPGR